MLTLRASSLPGFADCSLRQAARNWPRMFPKNSLRKIGNSIGSAVGSSVHRAIPVLFDEGLDAALKHADEALDGERKYELIYDATTGTYGAAQTQVREMVRMVAASPIMLLEPRHVEKEFRARVNDELELTGHPDLVTDEGDVHDSKFGKLSRPYHAQLGAYSLLLRSNGEQPGALIVDEFARRKNEPEPFKQVTYDRNDAEATALQLIRRVEKDVAEFAQSGAPSVWQPNPMSMMCTEKYCPLHSTKTCKVWQR